MRIHQAILGILSYRPMTGYDLKKVFQESTFMPWSGNNNQIYKTLVDLLKDGFVTSKTMHQETAPSKKVYTITTEGQAELRRWAHEEAEPAEFKNPFLVRLAWADALNEGELEKMLGSYENEVALQLLMNREKIRRGSIFVPRTAR